MTTSQYTNIVGLWKQRCGTDTIIGAVLRDGTPVYFKHDEEWNFVDSRGNHLTRFLFKTYPNIERITSRISLTGVTLEGLKARKLPSPYRLHVPAALQHLVKKVVKSTLKMAGDKYELTAATKTHPYTENGVPKTVKLHRIRALRDIPEHNILNGALGGWVEDHYGLSQNGGCWLADDACLWGGARILENAKVCGRAQVWGKAEIRDQACVRDDSQVYGAAKIKGRATILNRARVYDNATVSGAARVRTDAQVYGFSAVSENATVRDQATVCETSTIEGSASIEDNACVRGNAHISATTKLCNNAFVCGRTVLASDYTIGNDAFINCSRDVIAFAGVGSNHDTLTMWRTMRFAPTKDALNPYRTVLGISATRGCFTGTLNEFLKAIKTTHGDNKHGHMYRALVQIAKMALNSNINEPSQIDRKLPKIAYGEYHLDLHRDSGRYN